MSTVDEWSCASSLHRLGARNMREFTQPGVSRRSISKAILTRNARLGWMDVAYLPNSHTLLHLDTLSMGTLGLTGLGCH